MILSRGARLCEAIIRRASSEKKTGVRRCGRSYLARRLGCSNRQVSRYVAELRDAGRLHVTPPRKVRTTKGWRTAGVNAYRLPCQPHPAPHIRRSGRGDTHVTPPLTGSEGHPLGGGDPPPFHTLDPREAIAAVLRRHGLTP